MKRVITALALCAVVTAPAAAGAREPSEACSSGEVPPSASPAGVGVRQAGDPYQDPTSLYVCNSGAVVPGGGQVWVRADTTQGRAHVIVDGDSTNSTTRCTDGYTAARVGGDGAHLYRASDGDFTFIARERAPEDFATSAAAECAP